MPQSRLQPCLTRLRWSGGVTAGQAEIHSQGDLTTITQSSQNAAINWQSFSVAPQETVQFKQPNSDSITLNRVTGNEASDIQGKIKANGHIFISNPNGVLIGNNAQINVGGLVATTQKISDEDFMANRFNFTGEGKGVVENRGHIQVPKGGVVALVAPIVKNSGKITALQANTLLASAEHFSITLPSNNKFSYQITKGTLQGLVDNGGAILADGGYVVLTAKGLSAVKKSVINHSGTIQANTVSNKNGKIELLGDLDNSQLNVAGKLIAEAPNSGDGGFIETSAAKVKIDDHVNVSTKSTKGSSGTWLIDPNDFVIGGKNADMTANTLSRQLDNGNVTVKSTNGKATGKGDIIINKQVDWNKNRLTLSAQNDILINKTLNGTGTASLVMEYGLATSDGGESDFYLQKYVPLTERTAAINLPEGKNLRVRKGSEGEFTTFDVIHKMPEILEDGTNAEFPSKHIALGQDIDLSYTKTLNNPKFGGWKDNTNFERSGNFWGLGHKVTDLYINSDVKGIKGFLTYTSSNIRDIGVTGEIIGTQDDWTIGGLIGSTNNKFIKNSYTDISITGGSTDIGGLVGKVSGNTTNKTQIINSSSKGHIKITNYKGTNIGGLLGVTSNTEIVDSNAKVDIIGNVYSSSYVGGLIGNSSSNSIINSYAISDISLTNDVKDVGGLIGSMLDSVISHSYAKGKLKLPNATSNYTNNEGIGGLVGSVWAGNISNSYANLDINAPKAIVGGLIGSASYWGHEDSTVSIKNSYSLGNIIGSTVGGLIGYIDTSGNILDSYSNSNIEGTTSYWQDGVGGIIGKLKYANIQLQNVYSVGEITGKQNVAGLVVKDSGNITVNNSYTLGDVKGEENVKRFIASSYDEDITTTNSGVLDDDALKDKSSFKNWDFENVWEIKEGQYPTLRNVGVVTPEAPPVVEDVDEPEVEPVKPKVPQPQPEIDHKPKALELLKSAALIRKNMENKLTILANQGVDADIVSLNNNIANAKREAQAEIEKVTNSQDKLELNLQLDAITLLDDATINAAKQTAAQKRKEAEDKRLEEERKQKEAARLEKERKEKAEAARLEKERKEKAESDRLAQEAARIKAEKLKEDQKLKDAARDAYNKAFVTQKQMQARLNNGEISFGKASEQVAREKETARRAIEIVNDASYRSEYLAKLNSIKPLVAVKPAEQPKPVPSKPINQPKVEGKPEKQSGIINKISKDIEKRIDNVITDIKQIGDKGIDIASKIAKDPRYRITEQDKLNRIKVNSKDLGEYSNKVDDLKQASLLYAKDFGTRESYIIDKVIEFKNADEIANRNAEDYTSKISDDIKIDGFSFSIKDYVSSRVKTNSLIKSYENLTNDDMENLNTYLGAVKNTSVRKRIDEFNAKSVKYNELARNYKKKFDAKQTLVDSFNNFTGIFVASAKAGWVVFKNIYPADKLEEGMKIVKDAHNLINKVQDVVNSKIDENGGKIVKDVDAAKNVFETTSNNIPNMVSNIQNIMKREEIIRNVDEFILGANEIAKSVTSFIGEEKALPENISEAMEKIKNVHVYRDTLVQINSIPDDMLSRDEKDTLTQMVSLQMGMDISKAVVSLGENVPYVNRVTSVLGDMNVLVEGGLKINAQNQNQYYKLNIERGLKTDNYRIQSAKNLGNAMSEVLIQTVRERKSVK